jgi:hypothetical protein
MLGIVRMPLLTITERARQRSEYARSHAPRLLDVSIVGDSGGNTTCAAARGGMVAKRLPVTSVSPGAPD